MSKRPTNRRPHSDDRLPREVRQAPTRKALAAYRALVDEICFGDRAEYRESTKSRAEIEAILAAAGKEPYQLAVDCDELRRRWR